MKTNNTKEHDKKIEKYKRIRFVKKFLRYVPRRGNIHKYPILKYFANQARARAYLWSFRTAEAIPALYAGWILTMIPVMSVQILIACILSFLFRANIMILVALQFVSTPFTVPFLWWADFIVGKKLIKIFGTEEVKLIQQAYEQAGFERMSDILLHGEQCLRWFLTTTLGGIVIGAIIGHISAVIYKRIAEYYSSNDITTKDS
jgi:uncharacterized protein (DUF2062 family)